MMRIKERRDFGVIFKVENNSKKEIPFAFYEFEIIDKKGTRFKEYNNPDSFISKKLAPDEKFKISCYLT